MPVVPVPIVATRGRVGLLLLVGSGLLLASVLRAQVSPADSPDALAQCRASVRVEQDLVLHLKQLASVLLTRAEQAETRLLALEPPRAVPPPEAPPGSN